MKEVFDWLREQIDKRSFIYASKDSARRKYIDCSDLDTIINEAEAKWKEDCCEWVPFGSYQQHSTMCGRVHAFNPKLTDYEFCPYCRKLIKIVEVE